MKNLNKYFILYTLSVFVFAGFFYIVDVLSKKSIEFQKQILVKQAQTHYNDQITRENGTPPTEAYTLWPKRGKNQILTSKITPLKLMTTERL